MTEPLGVAFVEIEPVAAGFRTKTEAQLRAQLAGVSAGIPPSPQTTAATGQVRAHAAAVETATVSHRAETTALEQKTVALSGVAAAEGRATGATVAHGQAARATAAQVGQQGAAMAGLSTVARGTGGAMYGAAAAAFVLFQSLQEADAFAEQMHLIEAATGASADEMERASKIAIQYGRDLNLPLTSATDAATAINLLVRSGMTLDQALAALRGSLLLTAASGDDLKTSVALNDQLLDAFNLTAGESVRVADAVAQGMKFTQDSAVEFGNALVTLAPAADSLGLSLEATNTLVLQLAESGITLGNATSSLRQALIKLAAGGKQVDEGLAKAGLSMDDLRDELGNLRPDAFVILSEAIQQFTRDEQLAILTQIFSRRAALGVIRVIDQQRAGYERMSAVVASSGEAQEQAEAKTKSFGGALKDTKKDAADFGRTLGGIVEGPATSFVNSMGDLFQGANDAALGISDLVGGIRDLGSELDKATHTEGLTDAGKEFLRLGLQPGAMLGEIGKGVSGIVGIFRDGEEDVGDTLDRMNRGVSSSLDELAAILRAKTPDIGDAAGGISQTLATQLAVAEATGTESEQLRILREMRANALKRLERNQRRLKAGEVGQAAVQQAAADVAAADAAIEAILAGQAADSAAAAAEAEANAAKIEAAADKRDQAFIRAQQARIGRRQEAVSVAATTDPLSDDIRANIKLRKLLTTAIAETQARIREARAAGRSAEALASQLAQLRVARRAVRREIEALQREQREQAAETRVEQAQLDLQIAETRIGDDPTVRQANRLIQGHLKVIAALKKQQSMTKRRSVEWKRLQLAIEQERAAIRQLRKETSAAGDEASFGQLAFEFLGTLQGFAANVSSNVLPGGAAGGAVGGVRGPRGVQTASTISSPFRPRAQVAEAEAARKEGMTQAQAATLIHLGRQTLKALQDLHRGAGHPELRKATARGSSSMDTQ